MNIHFILSGIYTNIKSLLNSTGPKTLLCLLIESEALCHSSAAIATGLPSLDLMLSITAKNRTNSAVQEGAAARSFSLSSTGRAHSAVVDCSCTEGCRCGLLGQEYPEK